MYTKSLTIKRSRKTSSQVFRWPLLFLKILTIQVGIAGNMFLGSANRDEMDEKKYMSSDAICVPLRGNFYQNEHLTNML